MTTEEKPSRHKEWFATAAFSTIALVAITSSFGNISNQTKEVKWAVGGVSSALGLSGLASFAHVAKEKFVGTPIEGGLALITFGMWCAVIPAIMDPNNHLATIYPSIGKDGVEIYNNNLYFFSWLSFMAAFATFMQYFTATRGVGSDGGKKGMKPMVWFALVATSWIVTLASSRLYDTRGFNCGSSNLSTVEDDRCERTRLGFSWGAISGFVALIWGVLMSFTSIVIIDAFLSAIIMTGWIFCIIYITFGNPAKMPAHYLGNLYFFTWISFILSVILFANGIHNLFYKETAESGEKKAEEGQAEHGDEENPPQEDTPAE